jgi:drug/metabolite transporter (DMT)-like permease
MKPKIKLYLALQLLLMFYSSVGVFGKLASQHEFMSIPFILFYGAEILVLGIYAIAWQQFIKRMPLSAAYANRAVMIIWGCIWGVLIFHEHLTAGKIIGGLLVLGGVVLYGIVDGRESDAGRDSDSASEEEKAADDE